MNVDRVAPRLHDWLRRNGDRVDGSTRQSSFAREAALSLGVRNVAMHVEASRCAVSAALRRARVCRDAERLDLSDLVSVDIAGNGSDVDLRARFERDRSLATRPGIFVDEPATGDSLLCVVSRDRLGVGVVCVLVGAARALEFAVVVVPAAVLLPAGDVLRDDQVGCDGHPRTSGWLGKTGTQSNSRSPPLTFSGASEPK